MRVHETVPSLDIAIFEFKYLSLGIKYDFDVGIVSCARFAYRRAIRFFPMGGVMSD